MRERLRDRELEDEGSGGGVLRPQASDAVFLVGAVVIVLLAVSMSVEADGVSLPGFPGRRLPELCLARQWGFECATCGVTRSLISLGHGDWRGSVHYHPFGWLVGLIIGMQVPYRAFRLARPKWDYAMPAALGTALVGVTVILLSGNWLGRLLGLW